MFRFFASILVLGFAEPTFAADKLVEPLVDGRVIRTANAVAMIDVRAKSIGPGACAVVIGLDDRQVSVLAPPLSYSGWVAVFPHAGPVSVTASLDVKCDTGVMAEVRYYPR